MNTVIIGESEAKAKSVSTGDIITIYGSPYIISTFKIDEQYYIVPVNMKTGQQYCTPIPINSPISAINISKILQIKNKFLYYIDKMEIWRNKHE